MKKNAVKNVLIVVLMLFVFSIFINQNHINATTLGEINHTIRADKEVLEPGEAISITIRINEFTAIPGPEKNIQAYLSTLKYDLSLFDVRTNGGDQAQGLIYLDKSTYEIHPHNAMYSEFPPDTFQVMYHEKEPELIIVQAFFSTNKMLLANNDFDVVTITFYAKEGVNGIGVFEMTNDAEWSDTGYAPFQGDPNNLFTINNSLAYLEIPVGNTSVINSTITFKSLGGTTVESIVAEVGATISEPTSPSKTGYIFDGWYLSHNDGITLDEKFVFDVMPEEDITLYAKWIPITYQIEFNANGGTGNMSSINGTYDQEVELPSNTFTRAGYKFLGWATTPTGPVKYSDAQEVSNLTNVSDSIITLYAVWEKEEYTLTIDSPYIIVKRNGVNLDTGSKIYYEDVLIITYIREGYSSGNILVNGVALTGDEYTVGTDDVTITVINEVEETYTITYDLDGGINNQSNPTTYTINTPTITLENPSKQGYNFLGWFDSKTGGSKITTITQGSTGSITLYARWEEVEGYYDLTLKEIRLKTLDNKLIKTIDSIDDEIFVIIDNPYDNLLLQAIPTFHSTTVSSEITVALEVGVEKIVEFEVISLSGDTKKYKLIIVRDSQPILTNISFGQDIEFEFDGSLSYLVDVNKEVDKLDLLLETNDELNKVYIDEELLTLENLSSLETINLNNPGEVTVVTIVVKSYTEETETVYTLTINRAGKSNQAKLTNLVVEGKTLYQKGTSTPGFSENIYDYLLVIPFTNNAITVIPTAVEGATFEVICPNQLVVGENLVRVIVTSEDESKTQEYTITVTKLSGSSTAEIEEIKVIDTTTNESRIINNIELGNLLSITVPYEFSQVKFEITLSNESVNASVINPGVINLVEGDNIVIIKTIAEDETEYTYQLIVERESGDTDATLAKLKVSDNLNQEYDINFKPDLYLYAFVVNIADVNSLKVQAISTSNKASVIIGDENMNPYNPNNIVLDDVLDIYIWVIPQKGAPKAYIVHIVKDVRASIPQLSTIIISDGSGQILNHLLNTPFKADVYDYTLTVDYTVNEIFIAGIGVSNAKIISGQHTTNLQTLPQENIIEVVVEAEDGLSTATYTFTVYRLKPSHIAELESIRVNDDVITIEKDRFNYQLEVSHQIDSVVLIPYTRLNVESIVINGVVFNEKAPQSYQLSSETTQFVITVTAEDKVTKATYILVIAKKDQAKKAIIIDVILEENDANFMDRTPSGDFVKGEFKQNRSIQYIFVPARIDKLDMKLVLDQNNKLEGFDTDELTVTLDYGYNIVPLVVVAEDGVSKAYYFFIIHRDERSSDCSLKELKVNNEGLELVKKDDYTYTIKTTHRISSLDLVVELNNPHASYQIVGNDSLGEKDIVQVVVTAEDGTVCTYTITVTQESGFNLSESLIYIVLGFLLLLNVFNLGLLISLNRRY